jgi:hypothetical protein
MNAEMRLGELAAWESKNCRKRSKIGLDRENPI